MSYGTGRRHGSDLELLLLWRRPAATTPFRPLAWELPYAAGVALKRAKKERKKKEGRKEKRKEGRKEERKEGRKEGRKKTLLSDSGNLLSCLCSLDEIFL